MSQMKNLTNQRGSLLRMSIVLEVALPGSALFLAAYLLEEILVQRIERGAFGCIDESKSLLGGVAELLFDDEGRAVAVALIVVFVCDKAVELRTQDDRFEYRRNDKVEKRKLELRVFRIALFKVLVDVRKVDALGYKGLVVAAVWVDHRHDKMHAVLLAYKRCISSVAEAAFFFAHSYPSNT